MKTSAYIDMLSSIMSQIEVTGTDAKILPMNDGAQEVVEQIIAVKSHGKKVIIIGNGGSAAIASHMHNDLSKSVGMRALVFHEIPLLTAFSNDLSYIVAFEHLVNLWAEPGDMLIAISSSGQSENILRAVNSAERKGCTVVTFSGFKPNNPLRMLGQINFYIPSGEYGYVELAHSILTHYLSDTIAGKK